MIASATTNRWCLFSLPTARQGYDTGGYEADAMLSPLSRDDAQEIFDAVAAKGDEIAFHILAEGCECRAQLMIEHMQTQGIEPGRVWVLAVDRPLAFPNPRKTRQFFKWHNHVAPTVSVEGVEHGVLVIDPSTQAGPVAPRDWAASMSARAILVASQGLSQTQILSEQAARALRGEDLDAVLFILKLGEPPIPERGGSGFRIGPDPAVGPSAFARSEMHRLLDN